MAIRISCSCGKTLRLSNARPGAKVTCPECGASLTVPRAGNGEGPERLRRGDSAEEGFEEAASSGPPWGMIALIGGIALPVLVGIIVLIVVLSSGNASNDPVQKEEPRARLPLAPEKIPEEARREVPDPARRREKGKEWGRDQVEVQFLKSVARGNRFAIIADRSGSMNQSIQMVDPITKAVTTTPSINCLHEELIKTLKSFQPGSFFYISFFDDTNTPMPPPDTWVEGGAPLDPLNAWVRTINPKGGTKPLPAFRRAFSLEPRPDVIFFMTDGVFGNEVVPEVARLNADKKVIINTIQFDNTARMRAKLKTSPKGTVNRASKLLDTYRFAEPVRLQMKTYARGGAFGSPALNARKHLEEIAKENGGTFTVFGEAEVEKEPDPLVKRSPTLDPVMAATDQLTDVDPPNPHRPPFKNHKAYPVSLRGGVTYHIDLMANFPSFIHVEDAAGRLVASQERFTVRQTLLTYKPPADGAYRILISTSVGRGPFVFTVIDRPLP